MNMTIAQWKSIPPTFDILINKLFSEITANRLLSL